MEVTAKIEGVSFNPTLCSKLNVYTYSQFDEAFQSRNASFILDFNTRGKLATSRWVSPKRTRSYPYTRVYDTLGFSGKKVTIIPVMKDEGKAGDRDFLQWDTISLMSLLNVNVIIAYYQNAETSGRNSKKITHQQFDLEYIKKQITKLLDYQSDALHWNLQQTEPTNLENVCDHSLEAYDRISGELGVEMHSRVSAIRKFKEITTSRVSFMASSRFSAEQAQERETQTIQPKESVVGDKAKITIVNYLGGKYNLTLDEFEQCEGRVRLIEAKHAANAEFPSEGDIKDGILKMILFTNIKKAKFDGKEYDVEPILKLTGKNSIAIGNLSHKNRILHERLINEADINHFSVRIL